MGVFEQNTGDHVQGAGCPSCRSSRAERRIAKWLLEARVDFVEQKRFDACRDKLPLAFDFHVPRRSLLIEYDGEHHSKPIKAWGGEENLQLVQRHDAMKNKFALDNGYRLLRIPYTELDRIEEILKSALADTGETS